MDGKITKQSWRFAVDKNKKFLGAGFLVSLFLAGVVSFYASSNPDGLEKVAQDIGFLDTAKEHTYADGALADYGVKGIDNERASVGVAGVIGVIGTAVVGGLLFKFLVRKPKKTLKQ
jgi:cobalt/nickel transport protein